MTAGDLGLDQQQASFDSAALVDAAEGYAELMRRGGAMFVTLAGAMSTAELGVSLAEMIRQDKVHGICCTGANLEEDVINLVAHDHYVRVILDEWVRAEQEGERLFPHEFLYRILRSRRLEPHHQIDPEDSWLIAACERDLPIFVPGWEDSASAGMYAAHCLDGTISDVNTVRTGIEYLLELTAWYRRASAVQEVGYFQIGGAVAGDFPLCAEMPLWSYRCQISDAAAGYGSSSGAGGTPSFVIASDATIVAPLIFAYVLADA